MNLVGSIFIFCLNVTLFGNNFILYIINIIRTKNANKKNNDNDKWYVCTKNLQKLKQTN